MNRIYNPRGHQLIMTLTKKDIEEIIAKEISGKLEISEERIKTEVKVSVGEENSRLEDRGNRTACFWIGPAGG